MTLPLTDRTRFLTGLQQCQMKRYLQFHAGPYGYGFQRKTTQIPLATGTYVHACLADILLKAKELKGKRPGRVEVRRFLSTHLSTYKREIDAATFDGVPSGGLQEVAEEQFALVKGLVWAWWRVALPELLEEFEVVAVEQEEMLVLGCDCGADTIKAAFGMPTVDHGEFCRGVRQMSRPDVVLRSKATGKLSVHDFKTTAYFNEQWMEEYRESVQMAVGTLAVEKRLGEPVETYYLHPLIKGARKNDYDQHTRDYTGPKRQNSFLCYVYHRVANPPLYAEDFQAKWKYTGSDGKGHTLGSSYTKTPLSEIVFPTKPKDQDNSEFWVDILPDAVLQEIFALIGPYPRQENLIQQYSIAMPAEEQRWVDKLWVLYQQETKTGWESKPFQDLLTEIVPRSYDCYTYGSRCGFYDICIARKDAAWKDPLTSGRYLPRRPHHEPELAEMAARGIPVPEAEEVEEVA